MVITGWLNTQKLFHFCSVPCRVTLVLLDLPDPLERKAPRVTVVRLVMLVALVRLVPLALLVLLVRRELLVLRVLP